MSDNTILHALSIQDNYLESTTLTTSTLPPGSYILVLYRYLLMHHLPQNFCHCTIKKKVKKVKNELDGQPLSLLTSMHVSINNAIFSPIHLVLLELEDLNQSALHFKTLDENNNGVILGAFYLQLLNKE